MRADAEALDRERTHAVVAALLEQLGPPEDMHALAVDEVEPQRVELAALHRDAHGRAVLRILEREEDGRPALVALELRHLAFDPERRQLRQPLRDAAVE